ncbi:sarcosine oxidase subunit alpha family protein [Sphingomonas canadensis]|uniref:Sarcosine oxidase subunit alpha family protein n=1 Tax=Sphingomonas canadensis TaxID=1219257 RepID=A0ABW3H7U6_9SPHN|nr:sarcosine oxidase subunit alpha family protein [Sphingomonas canadensis]MCW3836956.1 sarcosine oxidase subunit alpha family protein [Sphingomonas canadensis]
MSRARLPDAPLIDRDRPVLFQFDGREMTGFAGDTLASALLANGVRLAGRSFKYHRPRGIATIGAAEPNALVTVDRGGGRTTPNLRATMVELHEGLEAASQNRWPSLHRDVGAVTGWFAPLLTAGFYYKTFLWPRAFWHRVYEPVIRRAAGLGKAPAAPDPDRYATRYAHCDLLVAGAGPAGIAAALTAAEAGRRVILCDENAVLGASLLDDPEALVEGVPARRWRSDALARLAALPNCRLLPRTTAFGLFADGMAGLAERVTDHLPSPAAAHGPRERLWQVRAARILLATGAIEQPLVFPGNDRPGVMLAGAARAYARRYGVLAGSRAVLVTGADRAWHDAFDLAALGLPVALIADVRADVAPELTARAAALGIPVCPGARIDGVSGTHAVRAVTIGGRRIACDLLLSSAGWLPAIHLHAQTGSRAVFDPARNIFLPGDPVPGVGSAGACNGSFALDAAVAEGRAAARSPAALPHGTEGGGVSLPGPDADRGKAFIDLQSDVTTRDIRIAVQEGFHSIEHIKRYTTTGMGVDQGKSSNLAALAIASARLGKPIPEVGLTTFRMPYTPVSFGMLAGAARGELFDPLRRTPIDPWAQAQGAVFEPVGNWRRARYFPRAGEDMHAAVARECRTVRSTVGLFDASTLGKIEVVGPDAATFMERIYTNAWRKLEPGRCRYGLMLREDGFIFDDGVVGRLAEDRFHVTTTTGGAARVLAHMEDYLQTEWPDLDVWLTSVTEQWAVIAVQGPRARRLIAPLVGDIDLSDAAMPHMSVRTGHIIGVPARLFRVSFTGELGFEVNVPPSQARAVWDALWERARALDGTAYGTEAMHVLRAEMGFIIVGQDTDGTVTPADAGLGWMIGKAKKDFVGKRSLVRPDMLAANRKQLVGLLTEEPGLVLEEGAQVVDDPAPAPGTHAIGHVTSAYWSEALGRSIAMALVEGGGAGADRLYVSGDRGFHPVRTAPLPFLDPAGEPADG